MNKHFDPNCRFLWLTPQIRQWLYGIVTALIPILAAYGYITSERVPLWLGLAAAVLATSTALAHTNLPAAPPPPAVLQPVEITPAVLQPVEITPAVLQPVETVTEVNSD